MLLEALAQSPQLKVNGLDACGVRRNGQLAAKKSFQICKYPIIHSPGIQVFQMVFETMSLALTEKL